MDPVFVAKGFDLSAPISVILELPVSASCLKIIIRNNASTLCRRLLTLCYLMCTDVRFAAVERIAEEIKPAVVLDLYTCINTG